jgi:acyl dehydratase
LLTLSMLVGMSVSDVSQEAIAGIVTVRTTGRKQDGTVVMRFDRTVLVPKRGHAVDDAAGY